MPDMSPLSIFHRERLSLLFFQKGNIILVIFIHIYRKYLFIYLFIHLFFEKDHLSFCVQRMRSYFREKEKSSFLIIQKRSYSSAVFLEKPSFRNIWKTKMSFFE